MNERGKYKTKQYDRLLNYLSERQGSHLTADDIRAAFLAAGETIGTATIYRQLERMVEEGIVTKYVIDPKTPACFEYVSNCGCNEREDHYHCKCENCGKLIHMECEEIEELRKHISKEHHFRIDPVRTVLYGICEDCLKKEGGVL